MSRQILVTGATGLIGRRVVQQLVTDGWEVVGFDRSLDARLDNLPDAVRRQVRWVEGDSRDFARLSAASRGADAIAHLAAGASFLMYEEDPLDNTNGTISGFHNVLEAAVRNDVPAVVYASTSAVYEGNTLPYREDMLLRPPDLKAFAKKVNEEMADLYADRHQLRVLALRPFSVYGEDEMGKGKYANITSLFAWALLGGSRPIVWGDGTQTRDFVHVSDAADAFVRAVNADTTARHINVGTGVETSFNDVLRILSGKLGIEAEPIYVPPPISIYADRLLADTSVAEQELGFRAGVSIDAGMDRVLERGRELIQQERWQHLASAQTQVLAERQLAESEIALARPSR